MRCKEIRKRDKVGSIRVILHDAPFKPLLYGMKRCPTVSHNDALLDYFESSTGPAKKTAIFYLSFFTVTRSLEPSDSMVPLCGHRIYVQAIVL
jgi:hypothetical protein